jgi:hypothetical protein
MARQFVRYDPYWIKKEERVWMSVSLPPIFEYFGGPVGPIPKVIDYKTIEFSPEEQILMVADTIRRLGPGRFLSHIAVAEGDVGGDVRSISIANIDRGEYPQERILAPLRHRLAERDGLAVATVLAEIQARRAEVLTLTGQHVAGTPSEVAFVDTSRLEILRPQKPPVQMTGIARPDKPFEGTDTQLWERIFRFDQYGAEHRMRFGGITALDREDHSLTVIRLLNALARWTSGDASRMRAMMLMSPLANEKWFSKRGNGDWLDYQIANAIEYVKRGR